MSSATINIKASDIKLHCSMCNKMGTLLTYQLRRIGDSIIALCPTCVEKWDFNENKYLFEVAIRDFVEKISCAK